MAGAFNGVLSNMIDPLIEQIIKNPFFLRLKNIVENNPYHDSESVYDHLIKTKDIAQREIKADFITNPEAKKLFLEFVNQDFDGLKRADLMVIGALLHDIGKILSVKENGKSHSIELTDSSDLTSAPGHEYWGSTITEQFLNGPQLNPEQIKYISNIIRLHDVFQGPYLPSIEVWKMEKVIDDIKSRAEGMYIESMFNNFCDVYTAPPFEPYKELVIKIFNEPKLYIKREYVIT